MSEKIQHLDVRHLVVGRHQEVAYLLGGHGHKNGVPEKCQQKIFQTHQGIVEPHRQFQPAMKQTVRKPGQNFCKTSHRANPGTEGFFQEETCQQDQAKNDQSGRMDHGKFATFKEMAQAHEGTEGQKTLDSGWPRAGGDSIFQSLHPGEKLPPDPQNGGHAEGLHCRAQLQRRARQGLENKTAAFGLGLLLFCGEFAKHGSSNGTNPGGGIKACLACDIQALSQK